MDELQQDTTALPRMLSPQTVQCSDSRITLDEKTFRWALNDDAMATEKLAEGIRNFAKDQVLLEDMLKQRF